MIGLHGIDAKSAMAGALTAPGSRKREPDPLDVYLEESRRIPWSWATANCALWVADWIKLRTGRDPAAALRGKARTMDEWRKLLDDGRNFMHVISGAMDDAGFVVTQSPQRGDVAILEAPVTLAGRRPISGIYVRAASDDRPATFVVRSLAGLQWQSFPARLAWSVE